MPGETIARSGHKHHQATSGKYNHCGPRPCTRSPHRPATEGPGHDCQQRDPSIRRRNSQVRGMHCADPADDTSDSVQQQSGRCAGQHRHPGADERRTECHDGHRSQHRDQRHAQHIRRDGKHRCAMEVDRHGQHHHHLGDHADQRQFQCPKADAHEQRGEVACPVADDVGEGLAPQTQHHAKLRHPGRQPKSCHLSQRSSAARA